MSEHPDTFKMTRGELEAHAAAGCERCQDALRLHAIVDRLIESQDKMIASLSAASVAVDRLEQTFRRTARG